ncbi:IS66 family insertion sequence element accessory protein TnpB [Rhizobium sp. MJ37]|nr:IS66 family insertion sequence element accessory protein TnpB [Rhizobium sp. MJ37]
MALVQSSLRQKPASGSVFAFRGRRGDRIKLLFWDGQGFCLYYNDRRSYYSSFVAS